MPVNYSAVGVPLAVEGTYNFRDVGGYPAAGGRQSAPGVLYRSDSLSGLTDAGRQALADLGLARIIDLRSEPEVVGSHSALDGLDIETTNFSILRAAAPSEQRGREHTLDRLYQLMIERRGAQLAGALRALATAAGPALVHCTAGKDRTGVVVALALDAAGVERDAVVADYAASARNLAGEWAEAMLARIGGDWGISAQSTEAIVTTSPAPTMEALLRHVDETYGGSPAYLKSQGLSDGELAALRDRLTI